MHRPLFAAVLWSLLTWNWQLALGLGVFFELLWLDLFPAGTFIPPHALFAFMLSLIVLTGTDEPSVRQLFVVLLLVCPLAYFGAWLEQRLRARNNLAYTALLTWSRHKSGRAAPHNRLILQALLEYWMLFWVIFVLGATFLLIVTRLVADWSLVGPQVRWPMVWLIACVGAVLSLRIRSAHAVGVVSLLLALWTKF